MADAWIFGYGSLIWRPGFPYLQRAPAYIEGFKRRFWQASKDHRGTEEAPGRVVTLLEAPEERCWGMAYKLAEDKARAIKKALDHREKGGYHRVHTTLYVTGVGEIEEVLVYVADPKNRNYVGPASDEEIAAVIREAEGPSGSNREYLLKLHEALEEIDAADPHVSALVALVR